MFEYFWGREIVSALQLHFKFQQFEHEGATLKQKSAYMDDRCLKRICDLRE